MANYAHCLYCFDTLNSSLSKRDSLSLSQVQYWWDKYIAEDSSETAATNSESEEVPGNKKGQDDGENPPMNKTPRPHQAPLNILNRSRLGISSPSSGQSSSSSPSLRSNTSSVSVSSSRSSVSSSSHRSSRPSREEHPIFVTWNTCVPNVAYTFSAPRLVPPSLTTKRALEDTRFVPISYPELPSLECGVTLLTDFELAPTPMSWDIGKHGIRISFVHNSKRYGATYLPDVAREQGWTKLETLISLMRKAGWNGRRDDWEKVGELQVVRYQGYRVVVAYDEWRSWRSWVGKQIKD